jgi:3-hydroxyisobutyrate dehydrogenase-like beta-hydroxyacid dehydrogenase
MSAPAHEVGLIGLGTVGSHYRDHLLRAFGSVVVYDRDPAACERAREAGAQVAASAAALGAGCDLIAVSLPNPAAVEDALAGAGGLLEGVREGAVIVDTSTVSPETSRAMHALAHERGAFYLDAPISGAEPLQGGEDGARAGTVTFMVGGDAEGFARAAPVLDALGSHAFHLGPAGSGTVVKLISNLCSGIYVQVVAEAFALGAACGFDVERLVEVFRHTDAKCYMMTDYVLPRLRSGALAPGFSVELQLKDHRLASDLGQAHGVPLPMNGVAAQLWELMRAGGHGDRDITDAVPFMRDAAGVSTTSP